MNTYTDFAPQQRFYERAYQQIVVDGSICFPENALQAKQLLLRELRRGDIRQTTKQLIELMNMQDFTWPLYQRCVQLCLEHEIYPGAFGYLALRPRKPETLNEALPMLTVADIKAALKAHSQPIGGNRSELEQQAKIYLTLVDVQGFFMGKLAQQRAKFQQNSLKEKYRALVSMVEMRAHFLQRSEQIKETLSANKLFKWKINPLQPEADEKKLAKLLDGTGYTGLIVGTRITKMLPFFPGGEVSVTMQRIR